MRILHKHNVRFPMRRTLFAVGLPIAVVVSLASWQVNQAGLRPNIYLTTNNTGPTAGGGTAMIITGQHFRPGAHVAFDGVPAAKVEIPEATTIAATAPPHAAGAVEVTVTNPDGRQAVQPTGFTYYAQKPGLTAMIPQSGSAAGGTVVTLTGSGFSVTPVKVVLDDEVHRTLITPTVLSDTMLTYVTPLVSQAEAYDVTVTSEDGAYESGYLRFEYN